MIGCTNCNASLDAAVRRRLPQQYEVALPTLSELCDILLLQTRKQNTLTREEAEAVVAHMRPGRSGSDIAELVRAAHALRLRKALECRRLQHRLAQPQTTAVDLAMCVGKVRPPDLYAVLKSKGWHREAL